MGRFEPGRIAFVRGAALKRCETNQNVIFSQHARALRQCDRRCL